MDITVPDSGGAANRTRLEWGQWFVKEHPGIKAFIVEVNSKRPLGGASWYVRSTTDPGQLARWSDMTEGCNFGLWLGREHVVIDLDVTYSPDGFNGIDAFETISLENGIADFRAFKTLMVRTPSGGYHLYFKTPHPCANANTFPDHIDVRGRVGYVVSAGSKIDAGTWEVVDPDMPIMDIPDFLLSYLMEPSAKDPNHGVPLIDLDLPENIEQAMAWLKDAPPAIAGQNGDDHTYNTLCYLYDFGLSEPEAINALWESGWNARCEPPWDGGELEVKAKNALAFMQNRPGVKAESYERSKLMACRPTAEQVDRVVAHHRRNMGGAGITLAVDNTATARKLDEPAPDNEPDYEYRWLTAKELATDTFPPNEYLFWNHVMLRQVNPILGEPDIGKTTIGLHLCAASAAGAVLWGHKVRQMPVLMVLYEDMTSVTKTRMKEICTELGVKLDGLPVHILYVEKEEDDTALAYIRDDGRVDYTPFHTALESKLRAIGAPCLLMLDTLMEAVPFNENIKAASSGALKTVLRAICRRFGTTIITTRHPSRRAVKDGTYNPGDMANEGDVRMTLIVEGNGMNRVLFRQGKFNFGPKEKPINLKRIGNVFKLDNPIKDARKGELSEEAAMILLQVEDARRHKFTVAINHGQAHVNSKSIAKTLDKEHGLGLKTGQVRGHMLNLIKEGYLHMSGGVRGGKNHKAATIEIGPAPDPDRFNESTMLQMFNAVMRNHEGDDPLLDKHMATAIVQEIFYSIQRDITDEKKRTKRMGYETERARVREVMAWLKSAAASDLVDHAHGNDDGSLTFHKGEAGG